MGPNAVGSTAVVGPSGLTWTGNAVANSMVMEISGDRLRLTDAFEIAAGDGCRVIAVPGPRFGASCEIVRLPSGAPRSVTVNTGSGDDTFRNDSVAPVRADGQLGNDRLTGGAAGDRLVDNSGSNFLNGRGNGDSLGTDFGNDLLSDEVRGGAGDDDFRGGDSSDLFVGGAGNDTFRGGLGADTFDGGPGTEDAVVYLEFPHDAARVSASIDGVANDGTLNAGEGDNVLETVEQLFGTHNDDILQGSNEDDVLEGNLGNDVLVGLRGADEVGGGPGNDTLASNQLFGAPVQDGSIDVLDGSSDTDSCRIPFTVVEDDATISCELINED
jgi:Ca2+-binding RTX toxin-like protein